MPDLPEDQTDNIFDFLISGAIIALASSINKFQMKTDEFIRSQGLVLSEIEIKKLLTTNQTTVVKQGIATLEREMKNIISGTVNSGFGSGLNTYIIENHNGEDRFRWEIHSTESCVDCIPREGQIHSYNEWVKLGLPRSGFSVCNNFCKCRLAKVE